MKIIFDNIIYSLQNSGGGSVYWTEIIKRFNALQSSDTEIIFYDQEEPNQNIFRSQLMLNNLKKESFLTLRIRRYLPFTIPINGKTIFHSSYHRISKSKNTLNITTIHDFTTEKFRKGLARWVNLEQKRFALKNSEGIICISENTKNDMNEYFPFTRNKKVRVIYNGISDDFSFIKEPFEINEVNSKFERLQNGKYFLFIGHRTKYKNFDLAVKAASLQRDKYKLVVVGEPFSDEESTLVKKFLGENYLLISKLDNKNLNLLYNKAFALLYPSSYEGFGIPVIEGMRTHCPVIAGRNSSIPEIAGDAALLMDEISDEKISECIDQLEDSTFREALIKKGIAQSSLFSWDKTFQEHFDFYKEIYDAKGN